MFYVVLGHLGALDYFIRVWRVKLMAISREEIDFGHFCKNILNIFTFSKIPKRCKQVVQGVKKWGVDLISYGMGIIPRRSKNVIAVAWKAGEVQREPSRGPLARVFSFRHEE